MSGKTTDSNKNVNTKTLMIASPVTGSYLELPCLRLLRLPEVRSRTGFSRSEIYRRIAAQPPTFPLPVKLGRASAWPEHEINAWCEARIAERDARSAA